MNARRTLLSLASLAASTVVLTAPAQGATGLAMWPLALVSASTQINSRCDAGSTATARPDLSSKVAALLGGRPSSLDRIRMQQSGSGGLLAGQALAPPANGAALAAPAEPAAIGCSAFVSPVSRLSAMTSRTQPLVLRPDDFMASRRLTVRHTEFDSAWDRVRSHSLSRRRVATLTGLQASPDSSALLSRVNHWVNAQIRYVADEAQFGQPDYWRNAAHTLKSRTGDCEDIAIVKMQMLAALGVEQDAMFLTIARDRVRGGSHAMLIVRTAEGYRMLDDSTDTVLDAQQAHDYTPVFSFSANRKWLHGF
jgi:predicted transglutaminase-like cysteine proteinase